MGLGNWFSGVFGGGKPEVRASNYRELGSYAIGFNGEKNLGEMGLPKNYSPEYQTLRIRSWQSYLESEITQTVINNYAKWVIGTGLKLQSEPLDGVLSSKKIKYNRDEFTDSVEERFAMFCKSKRSDHFGRESINKIAGKAFKNAIIGGDVLVILRYKKGAVTVQLVDGAHICSPGFGTDQYPNYLQNGNYIKNGVEFNSVGEIVAYHIKNKNNTYDRIAAKAPNGLTVAFLVYGLDYRLDNTRGIPLISAVMESLSKLERYKEATLGTAEEAAKVSLSIEHDVNSTGENPLAKNLARALNYDDSSDKIPQDVDGKALADMVAVTTNKQVVNMPIGAKLKTLENKNELYFKDFYSVNIDLICAAVGIPPEVAMSKYESNFSSARAALKDWEHKLKVQRADFSEQFYQNIYDFWLDVEILKNNISAPGYLEARSEYNYDVLESYRNARFVGAGVPHIDPLKEVNAERAKLGKAYDWIPLSTPEKSTELVDGGDFKANIANFRKQKDLAKDLQPSE